MEESFEDFSDLDTFSICRREDEEGESFAVFDQKGKKLGAVAVRLFQKFCRRVKHHPEDVYLKVDLSDNHLTNSELPLLTTVVREYPFIRSLNLTKNKFNSDKLAPLLEAIANKLYHLEELLIDKGGSVERILKGLLSSNRSFRLAREGKIAEVRFENRKLSKFPQITKLNLLTHLSLAHNSLRNIPSSVGNLIHLQVNF